MIASLVGMDTATLWSVAAKHPYFQDNVEILRLRSGSDDGPLCLLGR